MAERTGAAEELFEKVMELFENVKKLPLEEHEKRIAGFSEVIKFLPDYYYPYLYRFQMYLELGDLEKAAADVEKYVELLPDSKPPIPAPEAYLYLAFGYEEKGDKNKAIVYYQKALERGDDSEGEAQKALNRLRAASGNINSGNVEFR